MHYLADSFGQVGDDGRSLVVMPRKIDKLFRTLHIGLWVAQSGRQQEAIADKVGITDAYLSELISGRKKNPSVHVLRALADELGITINDFFERPPTGPEIDRLRNLSPSDAAILARIMGQARSRR